MQGRRKRDHVIIEFLETFESQLNISKGAHRDDSVSLEDFLEYYRNIQLTVDDDEMFSLMVNNTWGLNRPQEKPRTSEPRV